MCLDYSVNDVPGRSDPWWIGWIEEVSGIHCQEKTNSELIAPLRVTLREALELNRREALELNRREAIEAKPVKVSR